MKSILLGQIVILFKKIIWKFDFKSHIFVTTKKIEK
jgi:hypothetical protein